ncbi:hypothetical protein [Paraburkholderia unamae]|uniref:Uncharacterized protein n=1 Tax=Paraburkholderia unamae TaxID=219649 RepID=A0ABX5KTG7_9BURK|nr:hypothetical protein [Paraburkholderia unamae]PVX86316.1 hypothetical protein C7402_102152 [Paraburkholderia unamae]CAG9264033.1 conserved hypothetical protein [Paraburkholderia unamae]
MKLSTARLHAYLFVAALSAILIQAAVFVSIMLLHVPERDFESQPFRAAVLVAVGVAMLVVRRQGRRDAQALAARERELPQAPCAARAPMRAARALRRARRTR